MIFLEHVLIFLLIRTEMMDKPKTCLQFTYIMTIFLWSSVNCIVINIYSLVNLLKYLMSDFGN